jgi:hypothetical protein
MSVEIRVVGQPDDVQPVVDLLVAALDVTNVSRPLTARRDQDAVRVYVYAQPIPTPEPAQP